MSSPDGAPGLTAAEARLRLERDGPNALPEPPKDSWARRLAHQFASPLIYILLVAVALDLAGWIYEGARGWPIEAFAIAVILLVNALLGLHQERRSSAALERLRTLAAERASVLRDGTLVQVPARELVAGDVVRIDAGDRVPADARVAGNHHLRLDESTLTGESVPVDRGQGDEVFSGTLLVRGFGFVEVTRTGPASAMGRLAGMLKDITAPQTPLERRIDRLGRQVAKGVLLLAGVFSVVGIAIEGPGRALDVLIFAAALAVAAVPEGLPAVLSVTLALGVERMARRKAVVRRLAAVETLGSVTTIATDKTGTITANQIEVHGVDAPDVPRTLLAAVLANDADLATAAGDPLDLGLLRYAAAQGLDVAAARATHPRVSDRPFDSTWKFTRTTVHDDGRAVSYVKGAPEAVLDRCDMTDGARADWHARAHAHAAEGLRVIAVAWAEGETDDRLSFLGLVLLWDPPRPEVPASVETARAAGIRVIMVTGDHPATARTVATRVGIHDSHVVTGTDIEAMDDAALADAARTAHVFARTRPEHKLRLVETLQRHGHVVAMTGDGVNDSPALKRADIGVAMGGRGSAVSREVADLVLLDDNFATIVAAVEHGRGIYENIQKFLRFLFSTNLSEVLVVTLGVALAFALGLRDDEGGLLLPLTAAQILWLNLLTDGLPALAMAFDRTTDVMRRPPLSPDASLLDRPSLVFVFSAAACKTALALALLAGLPRAGLALEDTRAALFHFMAIGQLLLTYPSRRLGSTPMRNWYLHGAVASGILLQVAAGVLPLAAALGTPMIPLWVWAVVSGAAVAAWLLAEAAARATTRWSRRAAPAPG